MEPYEIIYDNGVRQVKNLITHSEYLVKIKPKLELIAQLQAKRGSYKKVQELKEYIAKYGQWFTDESPLGKAIESGILSLPETQGGDHEITVIPYKKDV